MRYLTLAEVLELHHLVMQQSGGLMGLREFSGRWNPRFAQPRQTFGGEDLYPTLAAKAATLGYSLIANHIFVDGNKRVGHAAMETMLLLNGLELSASVGEGEKVIIAVASGKASRDDLRLWVEGKVVPKQS